MRNRTLRQHSLPADEIDRTTNPASLDFLRKVKMIFFYYREEQLAVTLLDPPSMALQNRS